MKNVLIDGKKFDPSDLAQDLRYQLSEKDLIQFGYELGLDGDYSYEFRLIKRLCSDYIKDNKDNEPYVCLAMKNLLETIKIDAQ